MATIRPDLGNTAQRGPRTGSASHQAASAAPAAAAAQLGQRTPTMGQLFEQWQALAREVQSATGQQSARTGMGGAAGGGPAAIRSAVGRGARGSQKEDIVLVQRLLNAHRAPPLHRIAVDGVVGPETVGAIEEYQARVLHMAHPDGRIDPGGPTIKSLLTVEPKPYTPPKTDAGSECFPLPFYRDSWSSGPGRFGADRGSRAHAGCDLYADAGTPIYAIRSGVVTLGPYPFYPPRNPIVYAVEIDHGRFMARYSEIAPGAPLRQGQKVNAGQIIARVGHMKGIIDVPSDMLHLEIYTKGATGELTVYGAGSARTRDGRTFMRRRDITDPAPYLGRWKRHMPAR